MDLNKIDEIYLKYKNTPSDINEHLETLKNFASECETVTEMGVRDVVSTWALLSAKPKKIISYDIRYHTNIENVKKMALDNDLNFSFFVQDVLTVNIDNTDMLFIDTLHTYNQLVSELKLHSKNVNKYIILHDTTTFGEKDEFIYNHASDLVKNTKTEKQGLKKAIDDFLKFDDGTNWLIHREYINNNGLTILKRK